ncbi:MAG TPA: 3-deoxy-D-manno-octulosonic acid transferase, partial [Bacteroidetes bacterium]|nr:3-deoxy-D-manno-octulosonic acid transferase [Bacteroidota bacterium]
MRVSWSKRLYRLGTGAYQLGIRSATPFSSKARAWTEGRQATASAPESFQPGEAVVWFHCASVGEFEQGRPLIELLKSRYQQIQIVLTFFSPSGYMARKNFALADLVLYLPADNE